MWNGGVDEPTVLEGECERRNADPQNDKFIFLYHKRMIADYPFNNISGRMKMFIQGHQGQGTCQFENVIENIVPPSVFH